MPVDPATYTPNSADVAAWVPARIVDANSNELDNFSTATRPTLVQVNNLIGQSTSVITSMTGTDFPTEVAEAVKAVVALRTAFSVELTYFPEQVSTGKSNYKMLKELYDEQFKALQVSITEYETADSDDGIGPDEYPSYSFPANNCWNARRF